MPFRHFNSASDVINLGVGACNITGAVSIALFLRPTSASALDGIFEGLNAESKLAGYGVYMESEQLVLEIDNGEPGSERTLHSGVSDLLKANQWVMAGFDKATGTAKPRIHMKSFDATPAWRHEEGAHTVITPSSIAGGHMDIGGGGDGPFFFGGDIAAVGKWDRRLSDAEWESLSATTLNAWKTLSPKGLWLLNQASVATKLLDATGNAADQTSINGTTVINEEPPVPFGEEEHASAVPSRPLSYLNRIVNQ